MELPSTINPPVPSTPSNPDHPDHPAYPAPPHLRGRLFILLLLLTAAAITFVLYLIATSATPPEYRHSVPGTPAAVIRVAVLDGQLPGSVPSQSVATLLGLNPDFVLVQHVDLTTTRTLAAALNFKPEDIAYGPPGVAKTDGGCAILARHTLYRQRQVPTGSAHAFAVTAEAVIDGRRFLLASAAPFGSASGEQVAEIRRSLGMFGLGPVILGGTPSELPDGMARVGGGPGGRGALLAITPHWQVAGESSDLADGVVWADLKGK
jgi:hypothetical protein